MGLYVLLCSIHPSSLLDTGAAHAGAWPLKEGASQMIIGITSSRADKEYKADGTVMDVRNFSKTHIKAYYQYGYDANTTLIADLVYARESVEVAGFSYGTSKFRTASIGARYYLGEWDETLYSIEFLTTLHMAREGSDPAPSNGGDIDFEFALITGSNFEVWGGKGFMETRISGVYRPLNRPYKIEVESTIGFNPYKDGLVLIKSSNFVQNEYKIRAETFTSSYKADLSLVHRLSTNLSIELGAGTIFAGRNSAKETNIKLGFWYDF